MSPGISSSRLTLLVVLALFGLHFADLSGKGRASDFLVKTRYGQI